MGRIALNLGVSALPAAAFILWAVRNSATSFSAFYKSFLAGLLAVFPAVVLMLLVSTPLSRVDGLAGDLLRAFIVAGLIEETVKLAPVWWAVTRLATHPSRPDERAGGRRPGPDAEQSSDSGVLLAVTAGLGFAFLENAFYLAGSSSLLLARAVLAVPLHGAAAAYLGLSVARRGDADGRPVAVGRDRPGAVGPDARRVRHTPGVSMGARVLAALALAALVHGAYDLAVKRATGLAPVVVVAAVALAVVFSRHQSQGS
jgi:RsiW-degrading membrane proteinase PrsW (M82 family)